MRGKKSIEDVFALLRDWGGHFTVRAEDGEEYVIIAKRDLGNFDMADDDEIQLAFPAPTIVTAPPSADELVEKINRDIALYREQQQEFDAEGEEIVVVEELSDNDEEENTIEKELPPPRRVRFEPLRGDLPPELQE